MAKDKDEAPPRKPLIVRSAAQQDGVMLDGQRTVTPGDPDYEPEYTTAVRMHRDYGYAMPYADR